MVNLFRELLSGAKFAWRCDVKNEAQKPLVVKTQLPDPSLVDQANCMKPQVPPISTRHTYETLLNRNVCVPSRYHTEKNNRSSILVMYRCQRFLLTIFICTSSVLHPYLLTLHIFLIQELYFLFFQANFFTEI